MSLNQPGLKMLKRIIVEGKIICKPCNLKSVIIYWKFFTRCYKFIDVISFLVLPRFFALFIHYTYFEIQRYIYIYIYSCQHALGCDVQMMMTFVPAICDNKDFY
jgi:hypothetical protein